MKKILNFIKNWFKLRNLGKLKIHMIKYFYKNHQKNLFSSKN